MFLILLLKNLQTAGKCLFIFWRSGVRLSAVPLLFVIGLTGCSSISTSSLPSFGFSGTHRSLTPDCTEIEKRMSLAHKRYALALSREDPAIYLTFTGNLSRTMTKNRYRGLHQMTDSQLDRVVNHTQQACSRGKLGYSVCKGANRLGQAYKPLVLATRDAHKNYCGKRPIR